MVCEREGCEREVSPAKAPGTVPRFCTENCRKRATDERHRATCVDCGRPLRVGSAWPSHAALKCKPCEYAARAARHMEQVRFVAELYNAGKSTREINEALGYGPNSSPPQLTEARKLGLIGYRNRGYGNA